MRIDYAHECSVSETRRLQTRDQRLASFRPDRRGEAAGYQHFGSLRAGAGGRGRQVAAGSLARGESARARSVESMDPGKRHPLCRISPILMARFDVHPGARGRGYLLDCQADVLSHLETRVVVPLLPATGLPTASRIHPVFAVAGLSVVM